LALGEELFPVSRFPGSSSPSVALGEGFLECFWLFPELEALGEAGGFRSVKWRVELNNPRQDFLVLISIYSLLSAVCWAMWKTRNVVYFEKKSIKSPTVIVCVASSFIDYWAGLHKGGDKIDLEAGAEAMKGTALHFHPHQDPGVVGDGAMLLQ
jgi:hypothetical protein